MTFRLTYATMFDPPEAMHERFETAMVKVRTACGGRHGIYVGGVDRRTEQYVSRVSPADTQFHLGDFPLADTADVEAPMAAAYAAWPAWRATPIGERVRFMRRIADIMEARVYEIAATLTLEVGKNRMEALGEAQETVDFFRCYADDFESAGGYDRELPNDPLDGVISHGTPVGFYAPGRGGRPRRW